MPGRGVAVVTGASYGLGAAIARQLALTAHYEVVLVARSLDKLRDLQSSIAEEGGVALAVQADITDRAAVQRLLETTTTAFPNGIDVLVNNAAFVAPIHRFAEGDPAEWEQMVAVNVWGTLNCTRAFLPGMLARGKGKVVFISSKAGAAPSPGLTVHSGTKHLVEAVAGGLRQEVRGSGVSVGVVRPGGVDTPGYQHAAGSQTSRQREVAASLGCWVPPTTAGCLEPGAVAAQVVAMVMAGDMGADITDINISSA